MIYDDPEFEEFAEAVQEDLYPKIESSALVMTLFAGPVDVKLALEMGFALLMDKPIVVAKFPGTTLSEKLMKVADIVIDYDPTNPNNTADQIAEVIDRLRLEGKIS